jgi:hypothetical protein
MTRALKYSALALILGIIMALGYICCLKPVAPIRVIEQGGTEKERVKKIMKRHGVNVLYGDFEGRLWFERKGRKVRT